MSYYKYSTDLTRQRIENCREEFNELHRVLNQHVKEARKLRHFLDLSNMTNTEIERLMIARVINAHDDKEPYCEMYDTDIEYLVRFSEHLVIKTFVMEEDEYSNHDYVALEPAIGLKVKIKRGHVRKLKALHASMYL